MKIIDLIIELSNHGYTYINRLPHRPEFQELTFTKPDAEIRIYTDEPSEYRFDHVPEADALIVLDFLDTPILDRFDGGHFLVTRRSANGTSYDNAFLDTREGTYNAKWFASSDLPIHEYPQEKDFAVSHHTLTLLPKSTIQAINTGALNLEKL